MVKYNFTLDESIQNFTTYDGYIQLSSDGQELLITNKKVIEDQEYILEADDYIVEQKRQKHKKISVKKLEMVKSFNNHVEDGFEKDYILK